MGLGLGAVGALIGAKLESIDIDPPAARQSTRSDAAPRGEGTSPRPQGSGLRPAGALLARRSPAPTPPAPPTLPPPPPPPPAEPWFSRFRLPFGAPSIFTAQANTQQPQQTAAPRSLTDDEVAGMAEDVLDVGQRNYRRDDYGARLTHFAEQMEPLDSASRADVLEAVIERDRLAMSSWLKLEQLNRLTSESRVDADQRAAVADAFATSYLRAEPGERLHAAKQFLLFGSNLPYEQDVAQINAFLGSGTSSPPAAVDRFRLAFAQDLINEELNLRAEGLYHPDFYSPSNVTLAVHLLDTVPGGRQQIADLYANLDENQRRQVLDILAYDGSRLPEGAPVNGGDVAARDPLAILIDSIAQQPGTEDPIVPASGRSAASAGSAVTPNEWDSLALEIVRWANADGDGGGKQYMFDYDHRVPPAYAESMAQLFLNHDNAILAELSRPDSVSGSHDSGVVPDNIDEIRALGNLFRITMLNPALDTTTVDRISDRVIGYTGTLLATEPDDEGRLVLVNEDDVFGLTTSGRAAAIFAAWTDGVKQGYRAVEDDRAAQEAFVGFFSDQFIDFGAASAGKLIPGGALAQAFGGEVISLASSQAKQDARRLLADWLFTKADTGDLDALMNSSNALIDDSLIAGLPGNIEVDVRNSYTNIVQDMK